MDTRGGFFIVEWRNPDGTVRGRIPYTSLEAVLVFNGVGKWSVTFSAMAGEDLQNPAMNDPIRQWIEPGGGVVITDGVTGDLLIAGPMLRKNESAAADGKGIEVKIIGADDTYYLSRLTRPDPLQPVNAQTVAHYVITGSTETVMRQLVNINAGPGALVDRRVPRLVLGPTGTPGGPTVTTELRFKSLRETLSALANSAGFGWDVRWDRATTNLVFVVFQPDDVSDTVRFSRDAATLPSYEYELSAPELTAPTVLGQGEGVARTAVEVIDTAAEARWAIRLEDVLDRRDTADGDAYLVEVAEQLYERGEKASLTFEAAGAPDMQYGVAYRNGSLVTIETLDGSFPDVVRQVTVTHTSGSNPVYKPLTGIAGVTGRRDSVVFKVLSDLFSRVRRLEVL